ncbi:MAG: hypothetical protein M9932_17665 [Xanthobacteraceae bacterium]|nr:hypothetical protein [Xanthobacteraceae bacterium]
MNLEVEVNPGKGLLVGEVRSGDGGPKDFIAFFSFFDKDGNLIPAPYDGLSHSQRGAYRYICGSVDDASAAFTIPLVAPPTARRLLVNFASWQYKKPLVFGSRPQVSGEIVRSRVAKVDSEKNLIVDKGSIPPGAIIDLELQIVRGFGDGEKAYIVGVRQFDRSGNLVDGRLPGFSYSETVGVYRYVDLAATDLSTRIPLSFTGRPTAESYEVRVQSWRSSNVPNAKIIGRSHRADAATQVTRCASLLDDFLNATRKQKPLGLVLITATTKAIDSENRLNRPQIAAKTFAQAGYRVVYVYFRFNSSEELCEQTIDNVLQLPIDVFAGLYSRLAAFQIGAPRIAIFSIPDDTACRSIGLFQDHGWRTVYEVRDDWEEFTAVGVGKWYRAVFERFLARGADRVACVSPALADKMVQFSESPASIFLSPNATSQAFVEAASVYRERRARTVGGRGQPVIGYFGHLTEAWFDFGLLIAAARAEPRWRFELIGFGAPERDFPPNVHLIAAVPPLELPVRTARWDVGIIPFKQSALSRAVDPIKVYDYLSLNLPVVSVEMGELAKMPGCYIYSDLDSFLSCCHEALRDYARQAVAIPFDVQRNTWEHRLETFISEVLDAKQPEQRDA